MKANKYASSWLLKLFLLTVLISVGWWLYSMLEYRIEEKDKGYKGEAVTNHYLAAEYFLRRMGQKTKKISLFTTEHESLQVNDTLFIPNTRISFDTRRSNALLSWVEQGGHLIITGKPVKPDDYTGHDNILDRLDLKIEWQVNEDESFEGDRPVDLDVVNDDDFWQVDFVDYQVVGFVRNTNLSEYKYRIVWTIEDENKTHGIQIELGKGHLTLLSDVKMFRNKFIDQYDHAAFLFGLSNVQAEFDNSGVFYYSLYEDQLSLYDWLLGNAKPFMISALLFIIVVLWMLIPRFGPMINVHQPVSRRFLDHLSASGNYHWRQGNYALLLNEVRKQLSVQTQLKYPEWINLSKNDQLNHFSELSQLDTKVVEVVLFDTNVEHVNDFVERIKVLEKLRKSL